MTTHPFHDEITLAETAEQLAKQALAQGLISSFVVRHFVDSKQFYIPNEQECEPLTPERAYLQLKQILQTST